MVLDQNSPTACMERRPVVFTVPLERRPKKTWGLLHEIQPRTALSKPMRRPEDTQVLAMAAKIADPTSRRESRASIYACS